jgi:2-dehydropantoate 2-reductase
MRILVVGAGAIGGYFGARLAQAGRDVTFLVRPGRAEQLRALGLRVAGAGTAFSIAPQIAVTGTIAGPYDAILLAVKAYSLDDAIGDIAPAVGPATMIVPLLNGMRHLDTLDQRFGAGAVLGGLSAMMSTLDPDGTIRLLSGFRGTLRYGERSGELSARVRELDAQLRDAGFDAGASTDILGDMWRKWINLASMGAITCMLRGTVGDVEAAGGAPTARRIVDEMVTVATASGYPQPADALSGYYGFMTTRGSSAASSMYRDLIGGNRVEGEHIVGDAVDRAQRLGLQTPLLEAARVHLRVYEDRR